VTLCPNKPGAACECQPQEGVMCPHGPTPNDWLKPCPFCAAGETQIVENGRVWLGMRWSEPVSVSVRHWCTPVEGQPSRPIERVGRDRDSAIAAWNMRAE
jgi:hypothetical protein